MNVRNSAFLLAIVATPMDSATKLSGLVYELVKIIDVF